jgi:hypothetical protein
VIRLEHEVGALAGLLSTDVRISGAAPWLLRIHEDGTARQVMGNHVRAAQDYLVLTSAPLAEDAIRALALEQHACRSAGALLYQLRVPSALDARHLQALASLKLGYRLGVRIEPVGLVPRWNDATGATVWLASEEPLLRLSADFPMSEFTICVDGHDWTRIPADGRTETIISLGALPIGVHDVDVSGVTDALPSLKQEQRLEPERLHLEVRAPVPWVQGVREKAGFHISLDPPGASLEKVLSGRAKVRVAGPPDRSLAVEARTFNFNGHLVTREKLGRLNLPADDAAIRRIILKLKGETLSETVQASARVDLAFLVDELGVSSLSFPRKVQPLRWKLESDPAGYRARLVDEGGANQSIEIHRYEIAVPDKREAVDRDLCRVGLPVNPPGALLTAKLDGKHYPAMISVPEHVRLTSLADLGFRVAFSTTRDPPGRIPRLIALYRLWKAAQPLGPLATVRKATVLEAFEHRIAALVCGQNWADLARRCRSGQFGLLDRLQRDVGGSPGFAARMRTTDWVHGFDEIALRTEFVRLVKTYHIHDDLELCDLALRLAFDPASIRFDDPQKGSAIFERLANAPSLARGAFLARVASDLSSRHLPPARATA